MKKEAMIVLVTVLVTAVLGVVSTKIWNAVGWTTVEQHNSDVSALAEHLQHAEEKLDRNYWTRLCDEWQEDLTDWLDEDDPTRQRLEQIRQKQEAISENDCYKYRE